MSRSGGQVLIFRVGTHDYGVDIREVREILNWHAPTPVPGAPAVVMGVIDLRGQVIPVVDLSLRLRSPRSRPEAEGRIVVAEPGGRLVGLLVDEVIEVRHLSTGDAEPPAPETQNPADQLVRSIIRLGDGLAVVIDPGRVLDPTLLAHLDAPAGDEPATAPVPGTGRRTE